MQMNHKEKLKEIYHQSATITDTDRLSPELKEHCEVISKNCLNQKGVYTVLITLLIHKILYPNQDVRYFQKSMENGFSGRSIDTEFITPTLKELGLPSMAETGWLTRTLEQSDPYTLDYRGAIRNKNVKNSFLQILDIIQKESSLCKDIVAKILVGAKNKIDENKIEIIPIKNPDILTIAKIIKLLEEHFSTSYRVAGGAKLPVLAFHAMYQVLIKEAKRYDGCILNDLGSHTASDRSSNTAGDIEIYKDDNLYEAIEVKLDKVIDSNMIRIAYEKIIRFNPNRYYILSHVGVSEHDENDISVLIKDIKDEHGCQVIINGIIPTLKYYLRLIENLGDFVKNYIRLVQIDDELKPIHKTTLIDLLNQLQ